MKQTRFVRLQTIAVFFLFISVAGAQTRKDRTVVIISLDGVAEYMLEDPQVPMPTRRYQS